MEKLQVKKLLLSLLLTGCQQSEKPLTSFSGLAMTMPYHFQIAELKDSHSKIESLIKELFDEIDDLYNHWNPRSEISTLNQNEEGLLSSELYAFLQLIDKIVILSEGRFDPTFGHWQELEFHEHYLKKGKLYFTLDGIVKGFALDLLASQLTQLGYRSFALDWAGEIVTRGHHPSGRPWRFAIAGSDSDQKIPYVEMSDGALATSGNYWHRIISDKGLVTHIFDPKKQEYLRVDEKSLSSVTMRASTGALADAFATTALLWADDLDLFVKKIKELDSEAELLLVQ